MTSLADSDAHFSRDRVLPQHQAALTLLQSRLSHPHGLRVRWLDLACGRGQILAFLESNLSAEARANLAYSGFDIDRSFAGEARKIAEQLGLACVEVRVGDLLDFDKLLPPDAQFDFITFTNTIHEVAPRRLATVLVNAVLRLSPTGTLFLYDLERIRPPELGAVPWQYDEVKSIVKAVVDAFGAKTYRPEVGRWQHATCTAWNVQINREYLGVTAERAALAKAAVVDRATEVIVEMLRAKLAMCRRALDSLTRHGAETAEEQDQKVRMLYEFWAVSRSLEDVR